MKFKVYRLNNGIREDLGGEYTLEEMDRVITKYAEKDALERTTPDSDDWEYFVRACSTRYIFSPIKEQEVA